MLEGDVIKNFGTQEILNSKPIDVILTHTRFIVKQKIFVKHFDREMRTFDYNGKDKETFNNDRITQVEKILRKKENWELVAGLIE
jgi:hypothetical protein